MLSDKDSGPMLVNVLLIMAGVPIVVWLFTTPQIFTDAQSWFADHDALWMILGAQPVMYLFWLFFKRRTGPFAIERECEPGRWEVMTTSESLKSAKELAHDSHRRVRNLHGDIIYSGKLPA